MPQPLTNFGGASIEDAAKRIAASGTLAVLLPDRPGLEVVGAAITLISGLRAIGKAVSVFMPPMEGSLPALWNGAAAEEEPLREFIISFDLTRSPIKELKYERADNRLDIILSPNGHVRREDVEFRWGNLRYDLVIALGAESPESLAASIAKAPEIIHEKPILNIDANPENRRFGELNLVPDKASPDRLTLAELVNGILLALNVPANDPERATALFTALAAETENFRPERTSASAFQLAGELRAAGADPSMPRLLAGQAAPAALPLAGRALARSRFEPELETLWALVTAEDFFKTGTGPDIANEVIRRIRAAVPQARRVVLLWQEPATKAIRAAIESESGSGRTGEPLEPSFPSFEAAETHVHELLAGRDEVE